MTKESAGRVRPVPRHLFFPATCHPVLTRRQLLLGGGRQPTLSATVSDDGTAIIQDHATAPDVPWAVAHGLRAMGSERELAAEGIFIFIGFTPNRIKDHAKHDVLGFFLTDERMETSVSGIVAAGDICAQPVRQVTNAVADGTVAAIMAQKHVEEHRLISRS